MQRPMRWARLGGGEHYKMHLGDDIRSDFVGGYKQLCIYSKWMPGH